jgi:hemerythrin-like domain-containing protein
VTTTTPAPVKSCDAKDLVLAHQAFRRLYSLAPDAVRGTDPTDRKRVAALASTLTTINNALHHHHTVEDTMLWDTLAERKPVCGLHVELMKQQHGTVAQLLAASPALISAWRRAPGPGTTEPLAAKFTDIDTVLTNHLVNEEQKIIPVIEEVITSREWEKVGAAARATYAPDQVALFLGLILELMPAAERVEFEAELPGPVKFVWAVVGRRHYERLMQRLRPSVAPAGQAHVDPGTPADPRQPRP